MKLVKLKKLLIIQLSVCGGIILVAMLLYYWLDNKKQTDLQQSGVLQGEISGLYVKLNAINKKAKEIKEATKLWQRLNEKHKKREGLKIDSIKKTFDQFKKRYRLSEANLDLSTPVELVDIYKTDTTVVVSSEVTVKFKAITDEYVFSFIDAVLKELPGYVKVEMLQMSRTGEVNDDLLRRISKGENPELVAGSMTFQWRDLKDISTPKPAITDNPAEHSEKPEIKK
jgi:hypothetical protein